MQIDSFLNKIHKMIVARPHENGNYLPDIEKWNVFLSQLDQPKDIIDSAYNKYLCRAYYFSIARRIILNVLAFFALIISIPFIIFTKKTMVERKHTLLVERDEEVCVDDIFPEVLKEDYSVFFVDNAKQYYGRLYLPFRNLFMNCIKRYPFHFYFLFFIYKEFVAHSYFLTNFNPDAVAVYVNERNVASPLITKIYENENRKFISFMHGEYLLQLIQAYSGFSEYYVWDETYIKMFQNDLRWNVGRFIVYTPRKLIKKWDLNNPFPEYDYTYYLCDANYELIDKVTHVMNELQGYGYKCKIRPHPREKQFNEYLISRSAKVNIEDKSKTSLEESFRNTQYVLGLKSTSLYEAYAEGKPIVIDDMSSPERYKGLIQRKCRLLYMKHSLLSDVMKKKRDLTKRSSDQ